MESSLKIPAIRFHSFHDIWNTKKVGHICDFIVPGRNKPKFFDGDIPWITTPDIIHNSDITRSTASLNITKEEAEEIGSHIVPKNSIIISCVGDLGLVAVTNTPIVINQQLHAFIPKEGIESRFLMYALSTAKKFMHRVATRTSVLYMNKDNCNSIPISYPSLPEQKKNRECVRDSNGSQGLRHPPPSPLPSAAAFC